jgi:hypothetical protein
MLGRRRHARYLLAEPIEGRMHVREDVVVERWEGRELVVLSQEPCQVREELRIEFPGTSRRRVSGRVFESKPAVADDGAIRHRLRLVVESEVPEPVHT